MEETLTLSRVIENINYVYGEKLVKALLLFVLLEIVALVFISKKKPEWMKYWKLVVLAVATVTSLLFLSRSRIQEGYSKIELNDTSCAFKEVYDEHGVDHRTRVDGLIYDWHYMQKYGAVMDSHEDMDESVICEESVSRYFMQFLACSIVFLVGTLVSRCVFKEKKEFLSSALAVPIGMSVFVVATLFLIIFNVPYTWVSMAIILLFIAIIGIYYSVKNKITINKYTVICTAIWLAIIALSTVLKFYRLAGDARWQVLYARDLAAYHHLQEPFFSVTTYGFLGISLHAFSTLFGCDMLYAYFLVTGISAIAIIFATTRELLDDKSQKLTYVFMSIGALFLITNFDYLYYLEWILSNCGVGVCLLAVTALTYLYLEKNIESTLLIALLSFVVITTRIEGVCYAVLLLSIPFIREGLLKKTNIIIGTEIIAWQIVQFFLSDGVGQDGWTRTTGVALSLVGAILIAEPYLVKIKLIEKIMKHYWIVYTVLLLCVITFGLAYDKVMTMDNFNIFLSHFTVSKNSNSLALWGFILGILPLAVMGGVKEKNAMLSVFMLYILMVFGISIFRTGNPLHTGTSDSFRRVLSQIMPLAVWLTCLYAGKNNE